MPAFGQHPGTSPIDTPFWHPMEALHGLIHNEGHNQWHPHMEAIHSLIHKEGHHQLQALADGSSKGSNNVGAQSIEALKVDEALESLATFWHVQQKEIPRKRMRLFMMDMRLPLHNKLPVDMVLKVMTYIEKCRHHVQHTKDAISQINQAINSMDEVQHKLAEDKFNEVALHGDDSMAALIGLDYSLSLRMARDTLQEYMATELLAARSSALALMLLEGFKPAHPSLTMVALSASRLDFKPDDVRMVQLLKAAKRGVRDVLVSQCQAMMSGFTKVLICFSNR